MGWDNDGAVAVHLHTSLRCWNPIQVKRRRRSGGLPCIIHCLDCEADGSTNHSEPVNDDRRRRPGCEESEGRTKGSVIGGSNKVERDGRERRRRGGRGESNGDFMMVGAGCGSDADGGRR